MPSGCFNHILFRLGLHLPLQFLLHSWIQVLVPLPDRVCPSLQVLLHGHQVRLLGASLKKIKFVDELFYLSLHLEMFLQQLIIFHALNPVKLVNVKMVRL